MLSLVEIGPLVLEKKTLKFRPGIFVVIISPWKRTWPFIRKNLNSLYTKIFCTKFAWNWSGNSWEEYASQDLEYAKQDYEYALQDREYTSQDKEYGSQD